MNGRGRGCCRGWGGGILNGVPGGNAAADENGGGETEGKDKDDERGLELLKAGGLEMLRSSGPREMAGGVWGRRGICTDRRREKFGGFNRRMEVGSVCGGDPGFELGDEHVDFSAPTIRDAPDRQATLRFPLPG